MTDQPTFEHPVNRCEAAPLGWVCTRRPGHDGPCAAWPALSVRDDYAYDRSDLPDRPEALPWASWPWTACRARVEPNPSGYHGRCELVRGHEGDHALERGMDIPRWSTRWTG